MTSIIINIILVIDRVIESKSLSVQIPYSLLPIPFTLFIRYFVRETGLTCKIIFEILGIFYNFTMQAEENFRGNYITGMLLGKFSLWIPTSQWHQRDSMTERLLKVVGRLFPE